MAQACGKPMAVPPNGQPSEGSFCLPQSDLAPPPKKTRHVATPRSSCTTPFKVKKSSNGTSPDSPHVDKLSTPISRRDGGGTFLCPTRWQLEPFWTLKCLYLLTPPPTNGVTFGDLQNSVVSKDSAGLSTLCLLQEAFLWDDGLYPGNICNLYWFNKILIG